MRICLSLIWSCSISKPSHLTSTSGSRVWITNRFISLPAAQRPIWVRFVLVPGWTDDMAEVEKIAAFAAELGNVERVDVLPFHQMGRFKWEKLKMDYQLNDTKPPSSETTKEAVERFRA